MPRLFGETDMTQYRLDYIDSLGNLHLGVIRYYPNDQTAKEWMSLLAQYWKSRGYKVIMSHVLDNGVCITI